MSDRRIKELVKELASERMDGTKCPICREHPLLKVICPYRLATLWEEVSRMRTKKRPSRPK